MKPHTLVIGGTRGIGRTVVSMLAAEDHDVSVVSRVPPKGPAPANGVAYFPADLRDRTAARRALEEIITKRGPPTGLLFFQRFRGEGDDWEGELATSLTGTRVVIEAVKDRFRGSNGGAIVVVGSIASRFVTREQPLSYHVAKAGLAQLVRFYAVQLGLKGVRVNSVSPDSVLKDRQGYAEDQALQELHGKIFPLGRVPTSEEVGEVVLFLLSPKSAAITGQDLVLDGGLSILAHESLVRTASGGPRRTTTPTLQKA